MYHRGFKKNNFSAQVPGRCLAPSPNCSKSSSWELAPGSPTCSQNQFLFLNKPKSSQRKNTTQKKIHLRSYYSIKGPKRQAKITKKLQKCGKKLQKSDRKARENYKKRHRPKRQKKLQKCGKKQQKKLQKSKRKLQKTTKNVQA